MVQAGVIPIVLDTMREHAAKTSNTVAPCWHGAMLLSMLLQENTGDSRGEHSSPASRMIRRAADDARALSVLSHTLEHVPNDPRVQYFASSCVRALVQG